MMLMRKATLERLLKLGACHAPGLYAVLTARAAEVHERILVFVLIRIYLHNLLLAIPVIPFALSVLPYSKRSNNFKLRVALRRRGRVRLCPPWYVRIWVFVGPCLALHTRLCFEFAMEGTDS